MSIRLDQDAIKRIEKRIKPQFKYQVLFIGDSISQPKVIGEYVSRMRASNKANKLDNEYGGYRHSVKRVELQSYGEYR